MNGPRLYTIQFWKTARLLNLTARYCNFILSILLYSAHYGVYTVYIIHYTLYSIFYSVYYAVGVAKIFRFTCTFFGASLHIVEHIYKVSTKNDDRYPNLNAVLCLPLNNSTSILCSDT